MNETDKLKFKYDKGDKVLFVNRDHWNIDSVTVFERAETKMFPAYYVKLESGHITELPEEWLFADKKEAVKKIIECLKKRLTDEREYCAFFQGKLDYFQSANFQVRYMGEVIGGAKTCQYCGNVFDSEAEEIEHEIHEHDWIVSDEQKKILRRIRDEFWREYCFKRHCQTCPFLAKDGCPRKIIDDVFGEDAK